MNWRIANISDAPKLLAIYAPYVENTFITFEFEVPSVEEFSKRIENTLNKYPYVVVEENEEIIGYAYASPFKTRAAYAWSVETSIYVSINHHRSGVGRFLYEVLERILKAQNVCNLCAGISYPNPESISFHQALGYKTAAHFTNSGYKQGEWHDLIWMEKKLCPHNIPPAPFIPYPELPDSVIQQ